MFILHLSFFFLIFRLFHHGNCARLQIDTMMSERETFEPTHANSISSQPSKPTRFSIDSRERGGNDCWESIRCASAGWEGRKERVASTLLLAKVDKIVFPSTRRTLLWNDTVQTRKLPTKQMIARYHGDFQEEKEEEKKRAKTKEEEEKENQPQPWLVFTKEVAGIWWRFLPVNV